MFGFMIAVEVIVTILLIIVILMQASKGGGLAGTFGGGSVSMVFGIRRTADFLIRATQVLAGLFIVLSLIINIFFLPRTGSENVESVIQRNASQQQVPTVPQLPPAQPPLEQPPPGK
jgi:preprotein translocase subunit SecG